MNKGRFGTAGANDSLVTFWSHRKLPADGIRGQPKSSIIEHLNLPAVIKHYQIKEDFTMDYHSTGIKKFILDRI